MNSADQGTTVSTLKSIKRTNSPQWSFVYLFQFMSVLMVLLALNGLTLGKNRRHRENCPFLPLILSGSFRVDKEEAQKSSGGKNCNRTQSVRECEPYAKASGCVENKTEITREGGLKSIFQRC
jgi:hypothetical protein